MGRKEGGKRLGELSLPLSKRGFRLREKLGVLIQLETLNYPPGKASTFEDLILGLIVIHIHRVYGKDLFKIDNLRILFINLNGHRTPIDGPHGKGSHCCRKKNNEKEGQDGPSPLLNDPPVIPQMNLFFFY